MSAGGIDPAGLDGTGTPAGVATTVVGRLRAAAWYVAAWSPLVLLYTLLIARSSQLPVGDAMLAAVGTVGWAALLGIGVVALARRWRWPDRPGARFFAVHFGMALLYAGAWDLLILLDIRRGVPSWREVGALVDPWLHWQTFEAVLLYAAIAGATWTRQAAVRSAAQASQVARAEALRTRAELEALRGRLDPHFLFNTLHSVSVLVRRDPAAAERAIDGLAALLRYVLDSKQGGREDVPLADELAFVDAYLSLEGIRLGERLRVVRAVAPEALDRLVPSLVLQPLVENAIRHAIAPRAAGGTLTIGAQCDGEALVLSVANDGPAGDAPPPTPGTGVGLDALRRRLAARHGARATMEAGVAPSGGFTVSLRLPA